MPEFVNTKDIMGERETLDALIEDSLISLKDNRVRFLRPRALYYKKALESVDFPLATSIGDYAFQNCSSLSSASFDSCTRVGSQAFQDNDSLETIDVHNATTVGAYAFNDAPIRVLSLPNASSVGGHLITNFGAYVVEFGNVSSISSYMFSNSYNVVGIILRSNTMVQLASASSVFNGTPIENGNGWIYVPNDLVNTYKSATNWSTFASRIVSIDEYPKALPETITDSWSDIFDSEDDGTYSTKYSVGDTKILNVNGLSVCMQIAAFDSDELANGSGNAKITWITKGICRPRRMAPTATVESGWDSSEMRSYLSGTVLSQIDTIVSAKIKPVNKTYLSYDGSTAQTNTCVDSIWIPSIREINLNLTSENSGAVYSDLFNNANRSRSYMFTNYSAQWWLRTQNKVNSKVYYTAVTSNGTSYNSPDANSDVGFMFGFCT